MSESDGEKSGDGGQLVVVAGSVEKTGRQFLEELEEEFRTCKKVVPAGASSQVWQHFKVLQNGRHPDKAFCNHCNTVVARGKSSSPTNLVMHLRRHHLELYEETVLKKMQTADGSMDEYVAKEPTSTFKDKYAKWIVDDLQPLSVGESDDFKDMVRYAGPGARIPDRHAIAKRLTEIEQQVRDNLTEIVKGESITITTEAWATVSNEPFCSINMSFVNAKWELVTASLDCVPFSESHSSEAVSAKVDEVLKRYKIPKESIVACITDTLSWMTPAARKASPVMDYDCHGCLDHLLELVTDKFFLSSGVSEFLKATRALVGYFKSSHKAMATLKGLAAQMGISWREPVSDAVNKWWTTYKMLASILHLQQPLQGMMSSLPSTAKLTEQAWIVITRVVILLKPFTVAQKVLENEQHVSVSWLPFILSDLLRGLHKVKEDSLSDESPDEQVHDMAKTLYDDFVKKFGDGELSSMPAKIVMATALDPRTKGLTHLTPAQQELVWDEISSYMMSRFDSASAEAAAAQLDAYDAAQQAAHMAGMVAATADSGNNDDSDDIFALVNGRATVNQPGMPQMTLSLPDSFATMVRQHHQDQLTHEIQAYRSRPTLVHTAAQPANPLLWWAHHQVLHPLLSSLARILLAIPATSGSEKVFSVEGQEAMIRRSLLNAINLGQLMFLRGSWKITEALTPSKGGKRSGEDGGGSATKSAKKSRHSLAIVEG